MAKTSNPTDVSIQADASLLVQLLNDADLVFVKKLSNNDRDWARYANKHQAGAYIPHQERDSGFFPALAKKVRIDDEAAEIREAEIKTWWPQTGDEDKKSRLVHYASKGEETHLTGLPKGAFATLSPGSYLVIGRTGSGQRPKFQCLTIDSNSDDAPFLEDTLDLPVDFQAVIRVPAKVRAQRRGQLLDFTELALAAWQKGEIRKFSAENAVMPDTATLAVLARNEYLKKHGLNDLNPYAIDHPGDAVRQISREMELELFRKYQFRGNAIALVIMLAGEGPGAVSVGSIIRQLIDKTQDIDALMLSATQQRRSRAGYSFEHHIEAMLISGNVPFQKQVVIESKKRPDFVLPSLSYLRRPKVGHENGLILSAKTTLRERWKQVQREKGTDDLFLATVDETIASNSIQDMAEMGVTLVVPENLKSPTSTAAKAAEYRGHRNVLTFREFFDDVLRDKRMASWV